MPPSRASKDRDTKKARVLANRYEIVGKLGCGNFGTVFLCKDLKCNNQLKVLKEIHVGDLQPDETVGAMHEAKLLSTLNHIGVVKFHDSFIDGEFFCIVTDYCEGGDLDNKIAEYKKAGKSFDETTVLDWTVQLLLATQYIHSQRVLHRDLKARNIFIQNNLMTIGDFGISRILMGATDMASTFTGTPYYMSPEVLKHEGYNSKSDVWSLGCILYELCALEHAFTGQGLMAIMYKIVEHDPPDLPSMYSQELREIFNKLLVKDPKQRPSAADVLKFPYIARHMEKMKDTLVDEYNARNNISPEIVDREANDLANLLKEKSHLEDLQGKSSGQRATNMAAKEQNLPDKKLSARERLRLKKMQEADKKFQFLTNLTKIQLVENAKKRQENKTSIEKSTLPALMSDNEEGTVLKQTVTVTNLAKQHSTKSAESGAHDGSNNNTIIQAVARRNSEHGTSDSQRNPGSERLTRSFSQKDTRTVVAPNRLNVTIGGTYPDDRPIMPMKDKMVYDRDNSSLDFQDGIPETPDQANTFYEQFSSDFDEDEDVPDTSEDTLRDNQEGLIHHLEVALSKDYNEESTVVSDDFIHGAFGPHAREIKIKNIRAECVKILGQEVFEKAYNYLKTARSKNKSEKQNMEGLKKYVKNLSDCFLIDQLLFLEEQAMLS